MNRVYNFSAGPACLHEEVITGAKDSIQNFQENGIGLLEMSHRSRPVVELFHETTDNPTIEILSTSPFRQVEPCATDRVVNCLDM